MRRGGWAALVITCALLAGCSRGTSVETTTINSTTTQTVTQTTTAPPSYKPLPARAVSPLSPGATPPSGQKEVACPYIASMPSDDPQTNVGDIDGSRVYRTTVLTTLKPVGCRFYFWSSPYYAVADIVPMTFASAEAAHNAMVLTAEAGKDAIGKPKIQPGVDAVLFRTPFYAEDGDQDWACAFTKGNVMVVIHTDRTDTSLNALELAKAVAPKF
jgi:hypothetical protein